MAFGKLKFGSTRNVHRHAGKGARSAHLPDRAALNDLTGGGNNPTMNDYAKSMPVASPDMNDLAQGSPSINDDI